MLRKTMNRKLFLLCSCGGVILRLWEMISNSA